ncbi:hypothetical protein [Polaribacter sp. Z014]|nr:hypothetical protein [Polaribacter sp. Z014]
MRIIIAAPLAVVLSPRKNKISTQTGSKTHFTGFLLKNLIIIE